MILINMSLTSWKEIDSQVWNEMALVLLQPRNMVSGDVESRVLSQGAWEWRIKKHVVPSPCPPLSLLCYPLGSGDMHGWSKITCVSVCGVPSTLYTDFLPLWLLKATKPLIEGFIYSVRIEEVI